MPHNYEIFFDNANYVIYRILYFYQHQIWLSGALKDIQIHFVNKGQNNTKCFIAGIFLLHEYLHIFTFLYISNALTLHFLSETHL